MPLEILDSLSEPAKPGTENEDRIGWNETAVFVIDGATSLGDPIVAPPSSDAAWIAEWARERMVAELLPDRSLRDVVRGIVESEMSEISRETAPGKKRRGRARR